MFDIEKPPDLVAGRFGCGKMGAVPSGRRLKLSVGGCHSFHGTSFVLLLFVVLRLLGGLHNDPPAAVLLDAAVLY